MLGNSLTFNISNVSFQGKLVIVNHFSNKPRQYVEKVKDKLQNLVAKKDYNLFLQQDYSRNEMRIIADYPFPLKPEQSTPLFTRTQINIPVTSKASKYVKTSKDVMDKFEYNLHQKEQQAWEQEQKLQKKQKILNTVEFILYCPFYIVEHILHDINPKFSHKYDKLLQKIGLYL